MKRTYNKPSLKSVKLMAAETLLSASGEHKIEINENETIGGSDFLSNQEGAHDIWGNDGSSIW